MKNLTDICEGILDADFDIEPTIGDVYEWRPNFGQGAVRTGVYDWDYKKFWAQYGNVRNAWYRTMTSNPRHQRRIEYLRPAATHGFSMYVLMKPMDSPINQQELNKWVKDFNKMCHKDKLQLLVHVDKMPGGYRFVMWNDAVKDSTGKYIGSFTITKTTNESILDASFDIASDSFSIAGQASKLKRGKVESELVRVTVR